KTNFKEKNKIAVVYANGEIIMGKSNDNIASDNFVSMLAKIRKDSSIKAVVLRVNSPGGSAQCADMIERELRLIREKKPIVVSMGDYAASGGYWISANADKIFANNTTLTGSIGVFSLALNAQKTIENHLYINPETVNTNKHSDILSVYRPMDNEEIAFMQKEVEKVYNQFLNLVAEGRELSVANVDSIAQGRIWSGKDALQIKLADETGGIQDAITSAAAMSSVESYRVVEYPIPKTQFERILEQFKESGEAVKVLANPTSLFDKAYRSLAKENGVRTFARLPYNIYYN
ncbi:MAG: signal peptide peptidase SppA, partial [Bacteroidales bacterium]|nr:signal peptide peptidase SppA [Bacteroidales bacterium]